MKKEGISFERIRGDFVIDEGVFTKLDFYKEELKLMKKMNLDPNKLEDRMIFVKEFNLFERQKRIPHYWNEDVDGLIVDLSGYSQFVKSGLAKALNITRYEKEKITVDNKKKNVL